MDVALKWWYGINSEIERCEWINFWEVHKILNQNNLMLTDVVTIISLNCQCTLNRVYLHPLQIINFSQTRAFKIQYLRYGSASKYESLYIVRTYVEIGGNNLKQLVMNDKRSCTLIVNLISHICGNETQNSNSEGYNWTFNSGIVFQTCLNSRLSDSKIF